MKNIFKNINLHPAAPQRNVKATIKIIVDNTVVNTSELSFFFILRFKTYVIVNFNENI